MKKEPISLQTRSRTILADTITPVSMYLKIRDRFANSFLLESSDNHGDDNNFSYICCAPIASFCAYPQYVEQQLPHQPMHTLPTSDVKTAIREFAQQFAPVDNADRFIRSGLFGYFNYDSKKYFDGDADGTYDKSMPLAQYHVFQFIIALDHFKNECHIIQSFTDTPDDALFDEVVQLVQQRNIPHYPFSVTGETASNKTDDEYVAMVQKGIEHCQKGDVFQVVLSRSFSVPYQGDDFQVYRHLRSVNPSPYLFYFDYGSFRLFGSSPEAQIIINDSIAEIHPIAGTFKRSGDDYADQELAQKLLDDPKEGSEHVMLVDLARNDLSRCCDEVIVKRYKEVQFFSHVIHLVSKVQGRLSDEHHFMDVVSETFPAGTLSGAPKIRAMQIIEETEQTSRGFYGGAVGFMDFNGNFNHAIMIRTMMSKNGRLHYQAGAGVVAQSTPESEKDEVYNKVRALEYAISAASEAS